MSLNVCVSICGMMVLVSSTHRLVGHGPCLLLLSCSSLSPSPGATHRETAPRMVTSPSTSPSTAVVYNILQLLGVTTLWQKTCTRDSTFASAARLPALLGCP